MTETENTVKLIHVAKELNVGMATIIEHLEKKGFKVDNKPTARLTADMYDSLLQTFHAQKLLKEEANRIELGKVRKESVGMEETAVYKPPVKERGEEILIKNVAPEPGPQAEQTGEEPKVHKTEVEKLKGPTVVGKVDLKDIPQAPRTEKNQRSAFKERTLPPPVGAGHVTAGRGGSGASDRGQSKKLVASSSDEFIGKRKKRKIKLKPGSPAEGSGRPAGFPGTRRRERKGRKRFEIDAKEVAEQMKATLAKMSSKSHGVRYKKVRKDDETPEETDAEGNKILQVTEFISVNELSSLMGVPVTGVITACMSLGVIVSMNQRLDAEIIELLAGEFGFKAEFIDIKEQEAIETESEEEEKPEDLVTRPPLVTVMGHVDHGKTKLLDRIRNTDVMAGEAGGITQHIGAYSVTLKNDRKITFLDTPGHEAFTAMRARGAKVTDIAVIVIAADERVMPQTKEAISHAQAAGVSMIFAINKVDKPDANPNKIKEQLAEMNLLVEDWGGKFQCQEISAKAGTNVDLLLDKILVEADMLDLKANPEKTATGTVIEASLDKGKGYVTTVLVQEGALRVGDVVLAGSYFGKVKAMTGDRGNRLDMAGPSVPVQVLGLNGAPQAGDRFKVYREEHEAKQIAFKRQQILREQGLRTKKHITLDEIGRRLALGNFRELNLIVKGDVDGSVEALSDSLLKLSTEQVQVNIVYKGVGQITESDILLASASDAIIMGFQVRPSSSARKLAENESIEIRLHSIIYDAINELKAAIEGMHVPKTEEKITSNLEVREIFKVKKVGTVAGCHVTEGKIFRNSKVRVVRDGVVIFSGELASLKRFRDDAREVTSGQECGLSVKDYNDLKAGDIIESYEEVEVPAKV